MDGQASKPRLDGRGSRAGDQGLDAVSKDDEVNSPLFNNSLAKGLDMLAKFRNQRNGLSLVELAELTGMTKSSAQRCTFTLESLGYLTKDPKTRKYKLSPKVLEIGFNYIGNNMLVDFANPYLHNLNKETGETVNLAEPYGSNVIYVSRFQSMSHIVAYMSVGTVIPMHCSSSGRAIMSTYPREQQERILDASHLHAYTDKTVTDTDTILRAVESCRTTGIAYTIEEYFPDDLSLACAIIGANGQAIGAINLSVPSSRWTLDDALARFGPQIKQAAFAVSSLKTL